ncbi:hypothetical protein PIB30_068640 [Stylosanthes scabra]|uniref:SWIM-type domain-containing protein n=1 Tax=Stylosanthes scabra TaxID=79078 RepID=A0ABU6VQD5_9FABA|nr:hypothetical protein [Stylosanthes scabra]
MREVIAYVKWEIEGARLLNFVNKNMVLNTIVYTMEVYSHQGVNVLAIFDKSIGKVDCQCGFWKKNGYACRHMFYVMKAEHLKEIPDRLVLKRATTAQWLFILGAQRLLMFQMAISGLTSLFQRLEGEYRGYA